MEGWISLHRKIQKNTFLWNKKRKFSKFEAWVSLLFKANYKDTETKIDNKTIEIKKGSFITSEVKLSEEWNWNRTTVRKFLEQLKEQQRIQKVCTSKYTSISIENWDLYQNTEQQNIQQKEQRFRQRSVHRQ